MRVRRLVGILLIASFRCLLALPWFVLWKDGNDVESNEAQLGWMDMKVL